MLNSVEIARLKKYLENRNPFPVPTENAVARAIAENFPAIREEARSLVRDSVWSPYFASDTYRGEWDLFWFKANGKADKENYARCPNTAAIVERFPEVRYAAFSALVPGTHITPHSGIPGVVRIHLGVAVEEGKAGWKCNHESRECRPGEVVLFEDGFEHEAWNWGDEPRITLMLTIASPDLSEEDAEEIFRLHDKKYGFYYVLEKLASARGGVHRVLFRMISPVVRVLDPVINKAIFVLKPVFILFMSRWAKKKTLIKSSP